MAILSISLAVVASAATWEGEPRKAECVVTGRGSGAFRGPCLFHPGENGSFTIEAAGKQDFAQASSISLHLTRRNAGDVRGVARDGTSARWGRAVRSRRDPACWSGADFSVCVYER